MKHFKLTDILIAVAFGFFVFVSAQQFGFSSHSKRKYKNKVELTQAPSPHSFLSKRMAPSLLMRSIGKSKRTPQSISTDSSFSEDSSEVYEELIPSDESNEYVEENSTTVTDHDPEREQQDTALVNQKIETFLINNLGLTHYEVDRVLAAKTNMEERITQNRQVQDDPNIKDVIGDSSRKIYSHYQEELLQILGPESFQKFTQWNYALEADFAERNATGKFPSNSMM